MAREALGRVCKGDHASICRGAIHSTTLDMTSTDTFMKSSDNEPPSLTLRRMRRLWVYERLDCQPRCCTRSWIAKLPSRSEMVNRLWKAKHRRWLVANVRFPLRGRQALPRRTPSD